MHETLEFNPCNSQMFFQGITCRHFHSTSFLWPLGPWQDQILLQCSVLHILTSRDQKAPASIKVNFGLCPQWSREKYIPTFCVALLGYKRRWTSLRTSYLPLKLMNETSCKHDKLKGLSTIQESTAKGIPSDLAAII